VPCHRWTETRRCQHQQRRRRRQARARRLVVAGPLHRRWRRCPHQPPLQRLQEVAPLHPTAGHWVCLTQQASRQRVERPWAEVLVPLHPQEQQHPPEQLHPPG
jgi:hypothetical protein